MSRVEITYIKNVNCDIEHTISIDLEENEMTFEELKSNIKRFSEEETCDLEEYLYEKLNGDFETECVRDIYEVGEFEDLNMEEK